MDYGFIDSPMQSPNLLYPYGQYFDHTSESSNPSSPDRTNVLMFSTMPLQYDVLQYDLSGQASFPISKTQIKYSGSSILDESDRKRRRTGSTTSSKESQEALPSMHLRRRAQNRASQRAFRERKEKHVKGLEHQLEDLHEKHQDLLETYTRQTDELSKLKARVAELSAELESVQTGADHTFNEMTGSTKFEKFDAFLDRNLSHIGFERCFEQEVVEYDADTASRSFEDSL